MSLLSDVMRSSSCWIRLMRRSPYRAGRGRGSEKQKAGEAFPVGMYARPAVLEDTPTLHESGRTCTAGKVAPMYVYIESEPGLYTVGHYDPSGRWIAESDWESAAEASARVHYLNGGAVVAAEVVHA